MASDDLDLDAMLDSAFDESVGTEDVGICGENGENGVGKAEEIDLDSILDDTLGDVSGPPPTASKTSNKGSAAKTTKRNSTPSTRASNEFGPSQEWLQRKQGRKPQSATQGSGGTAGAAPEPWAFLSPERQRVWTTTLADDDKRQANMDKQRPLSRAYRSFYASKEESGIVVHLGSAANNTDGKEGDAAEQGTEGGDSIRGVEDEKGGPADMFEDVLAKGVASSGVRQPPTVDEGDYKALESLKASYLRVVAKDVRARMADDPDVDPARFPAIASKIVA